MNAQHLPFTVFCTAEIYLFPDVNNYRLQDAYFTILPFSWHWFQIKNCNFSMPLLIFFKRNKIIRAE